VGDLSRLGDGGLPLGDLRVIQKSQAEMPSLVHSEARRQLARRKLRHFIPHSWKVIESKQPYTGGWHIDCICDHLEGVSAGHIKRLLINLPPRHMKSTLTTVMFPAWKWLSDPGCRIINCSYDTKLATRDCIKSRRIITSPGYQLLKEPDKVTGEPWRLSSDQNLKMRYSNDHTGERVALSMDGGATGEGGDIIIVDDPHNVKKISKTTLTEAKLWWTETMPSRLNDPENGVFIVVMQRVHDDDLSGVILSGDDEYVHVCLEARYEGKTRIFTPLDWIDPRRKKGQPLWPERLSDKKLSKLRKGLTAYAWSGQYQQRPTPREGGIFKERDFEIIESINMADVQRTCRYWDKAGTDGAGDYTVGCLVHKMKDGSYVIADVVRGQWSYAKREAKMLAVSLQDFEKYGGNNKARYTIAFEQEPGSGGKDSATITKNNLLWLNGQPNTEYSPLSGCRILIEKVTGSKEVRAEPFAVKVENGLIKVLKRNWTKEFIEEMTVFPNGSNDDQVDTASGGVRKLSATKKRAGTW